MHHHTDRITHTTAFVTPVVEHWLEQEIDKWVHHEWSIRANALAPLRLQSFKIMCQKLAQAMLEFSFNKIFLYPIIRRKEGNVLFNDALNTFYLRLYGDRYMVKHPTLPERKPAASTWATLPVWQQGSFICTIPQTGWCIQRPLLQQSWSTSWNEK